MSFARAKRFDYKNPDIRVSPADYYIATTLEKSCTISKCPRFPTKNEEPSTSTSCSRMSGRSSQRESQKTVPNCCHRFSYQRGPVQSSTPLKKTRNSNSTDVEKMKNKIVNLNNELNFTFQGKSKNFPRTQNKVKNLVHKYEHLPVNFLAISDEFIDDDYHSYTSSDDLELRLHDKTSGRKAFEKLVLEKISSIEKHIYQFQENLGELNYKICLKYDKKSLYPDRKYKGHSDSQISVLQDVSPDIRFIIFEAIENLRKEFENKKQKIISETTKKIKNLLNELHADDKDSTKDIKRICDNTANNLYEDVMEYIDKNDTLEHGNLEFDTSYNSEIWLAEETVARNSGEKSFNYENLCKILSDQLQVSHRELEDLKKDKMDITLKCGNTQQKLLAQTSTIDMLHEEIAELKKTC